MLANYPKLMPSPMCQHGDKNTIPEEISQDAGLFSYTNGFPFITQIDIKAGGKAPERKDFNGILNEITQHIFYMQCGGQYLWNKELDYQVGALVFGSDKKMYKALQVSGKKQNAGAKDPINTANAAYWELFDTKELIALHNNDQNAHKGLFDSIKNNFNDFASKTKDNVFTGLNLIQHRELRFKNPTLDIFNPPASGSPSDVNSFRFFDKRNIMIGELVYLNSSDGRRHVQITNTYKKHINPETGENTQGRYLAARLGITVDADDRPYGEAPTPLPTQIGNYIATTKWVQDNVINKGYLLKKIAERTTNGDWTIPKVVVGKPLKIYSILGVGNNNVANISVKSGADTGKGTYALGNEYSPLWLYKSTNIFEIIPTSTTVILSVSASTSNKLVAYQ